MSEHTNALGQPIGTPLHDWQPRAAPSASVLQGRTCRLVPADPGRHSQELWQALSEDTEGGVFTYLPYGPFADHDEYVQWMVSTCLGPDPQFFTILDTASDRAVGLASYLRIAPQVGVIEVGHLQFTPPLQRTTAATEAMYLMMSNAFGKLGYRRYEWKCDSLNGPSRRAAERLGFQFEGIFRQATVYKGRNRDTAWYSIVDSEWPKLEAEFVRWLAPDNFDSAGRQRTRLQHSEQPADSD